MLDVAGDFLEEILDTTKLLFSADGEKKKEQAEIKKELSEDLKKVFQDANEEWEKLRNKTKKLWGSMKSSKTARKLGFRNAEKHPPPTSENNIKR